MTPSLMLLIVLVQMLTPLSKSAAIDTDCKINKMEGDICKIRKLIDDYFHLAMNTVKSIHGPRYFSQWLSLDAPSSSHVAYFLVHTTDQFLVVTSYNNGILRIYKFEGSSVNLKYKLSLKGSTTTKAVYIDKRVYLVVACSNSNSYLYAWVNNTLQLKQSFKTYNATYVDFVITTDGEKLLVFTSYFNKTTYHVPSLIYKWNETIEEFQLHQYLPSTGAKKAHFFFIRSDLWLTIACETNDVDSDGVNSYVYKWNETHFNVFATIMTYHSHDVYPVVAGNQVYLIATNFKRNYNHNVQSTIYKLDHKTNTFNVFGSFFTQGAKAVDYFAIETELFIAIANYYDETRYSSETNSLLYRFDGFMLKEFQPIPTISAVDIRLVRQECPLLAVVNEGGNVVLYKWEDVTALYRCYY